MRKGLLTILLAGAIVACTPALDRVNVKSIDNLISTNLYAQTEKKQVKYVELNDANYTNEVIKYKGPVIVMFYDSDKARSPPSDRMLTVMDALMQMYGDKIKFCRYDGPKVNEGMKGELQEKKMREIYSLERYPTTILFKNGEKLYSLNGGPSKDEDTSTLKEWLIKKTQKLYFN